MPANDNSGARLRVGVRRRVHGRRAGLLPGGMRAEQQRRLRHDGSQSARVPDRPLHGWRLERKQQRQRILTRRDGLPADIAVAGQGCFDAQPTQATINEVTNWCISSLVANAQLIGCLLEDDAGKAEDKRTGLTCAQRQAALARQCNARCANFAQQITRTVCTNEGFHDQAWVVAFGDLDGKVFGSARVAGCGPRLKTAITIPKSDTFKQKNVTSIKP